MEERMGFANYCTEEPILVPMKRMKNESTNNHEKAPVNGESMDDNSVNFDGIDRISNLPTEIICHILSFLPTKFAVGTCILSTKWKNLFALIPNLRLRLDDTLLLHQEISPGTYLVDFMNFADRLLNVTLRDVPSVKCFTLICDKVDEGQNIANWIHAALRLNIKSLDLHIRQLKNSNLLLDSLFGCSIVSLNLLVNFGVDAPEYRFSLPNLKKLSVHCMKFSPANVLLASCPLLEFLRVNKCYCQPGETLRISLPSLKGLKLISGKNGFEGEFQLDAPNLKYLSYGGFLANRYSSTKLKFLQLAILELDQAVVPYPFDSNEKAVELIKVSAYAEKLRLSEEIVAMLCHYPHPLPKFQKMTALSIQNMDSNGWELLPRFLECAPNLTKLFLKAGFDDESYERFKGSLKEPLPICLSRHHETCIILEIQRKVGKPSSSLPTCRAVRS